MRISRARLAVGRHDEPLRRLSGRARRRLPKPRRCSARISGRWSRTARAEALNRTVNTQPVMLAADIAVWRAWRAAGAAQPAVARRAQPRRIRGAGRRRCACVRRRVAARALSRAGDAGGGARRRRRHGRDHRRCDDCRRRGRVRRSGAGRGGRAGQFQCARTSGHRRPPRAPSSARSPRPRHAAPSARCMLPVSRAVSQLAA